MRRLALDKVGDRDDAETAAALVEQLRHPDRGLRDAALVRLTRTEHGRKALIAALLAAESPDQAWPLARAQAPFAREYPAEWREEVFEQGVRIPGGRRPAGRRAAVPAAGTDAADLRDRLEQQALPRRKKKAYETALLYLRLLGRDPACGFPIRLELAACGLKVSGKDLAADARAGDPCLQQFTIFASRTKPSWSGRWKRSNGWSRKTCTTWDFTWRSRRDGRKRPRRDPQAGGETGGPTKMGQAAKSKLGSAGLA